MLSFFNRHKFPLIFLILISFLAYINIYQNEFLSDDIDGIVKNKSLGNLLFQIKTLSPYNLLRSLNFLIAGLNPAPYHLTNVLLHTANVILVYIFIILIGQKRLALPTALIFSLHPLHTEAVTWISAGNYLLYTFFALISLNLFLYKNSKIFQFFSLIFYTLSFLTSEKAIILPLILVLTLACFRKVKPHAARIIIFLLVTLIFGLTFITKAPERIEATFPAYEWENRWNDPAIQLPTAIASYYQLFVFPINLTLYHDFARIYIYDHLIRITITLISLILTLIFLKKSKLLFFANSFFLISLLPTLLPIKVGWIVAERYIYFGLLGLSLLLSFLIFKIGDALKSKVISQIILISLLTIYLILTLIRNSHWKSQDTLWPETVRVSKYNALAHNNMGDYYARHGNMLKAREEFAFAIDLKQGSYPEAWHNLGNTFLETNNASAAASAFIKAITLKPEQIESYLQLGTVYLSENNLPKAEEMFLKVTQIKPNITDGYNALGYLYLKKKDKARAAEFFQKSLTIDPLDQDALSNLSNLQKL